MTGPRRRISILLDLLNAVPPTPEQVRLIALAASAAGDTGDAHYYMAEYHLMSGDLMLAADELRVALGMPGLDPVQRARFSSRLAEIQEVLNRLQAEKRLAPAARNYGGRPVTRSQPVHARVAWSGRQRLLRFCRAAPAMRPAQREPPNPDPFEPVNRVIYKVNDFGDRYVARPVARAYEKATPGAFRLGASNFLDNLRYPITIVNDFLQGKVRQGGADFARFALNSTVGLLGLFDPATDMGLEKHDEDFGQTLAVWGVPEGPYLMVPVFGPYTVTSAVGDLADTQISPLVQIPEDGAATALVGVVPG